MSATLETPVMLGPKEVSERLGCSSRGACYVIRLLGRQDVGCDSVALRVTEHALNGWLGMVSLMQPRPGLIRGVYFIADGRAVKIGVSDCVSARLSTLQKCNPRTLDLLATFPGTAAAEAYFHGRFRELRIHGEWYRRAGALDAFLEGHGL